MMLFRLLLLFFIASLFACSPFTTPRVQLKPADSIYYDIAKDTGQSIRFVVIGDWGRKGWYNQREVAREMKRLKKIIGFDFIISVGDNFYPAGVKSVKDNDWKISWERIYDGPLKDVPWYVALGNHDYLGNVEAQIKYSDKNKNWIMPARYHSFTKTVVGDTTAKFVIMDTNAMRSSYYNTFYYRKVIGQDSIKQIKWLDSLLLTSDDEWKILVGHHPLYSSSPMHGDTEELVHIIEPRINKNKIPVYFSGHDHDLQHLKGKGQAHYVISGAGSKLRKAGTGPYTIFSASKSGFVLVDLHTNKMIMYFIDKTGKILHRVQLPILS